MAILKRVVPFIIIAVFGLVLLVAAIRDKIELAKPLSNIEDMEKTDFYNGRFVQGELYELWGEYATLETSDSMFGIKYNTRTAAHYFLMPLETSYETSDLQFISVAIKDGVDFTTAQKMVKEFENYLEKDTYLETTMTIKGKVTTLSGKGKDIFEETLRELGIPPETNGVYYVINVGNDGSGSTTALLIAIGVVAVGVIGGLVVFLRAKNRGY